MATKTKSKAKTKEKPKKVEKEIQYNDGLCLNTKQRNLLDRFKNEGARVAKLVGFDKFNSLHSKWLHNMFVCKDIYVLKASRGSYKSSVLTLFIALLIICKPNKTIIFMRKTDNDVKEIVEKVSKILHSDVFQAFSQILYGHGYQFTKDTAFEINTTLKTDLGGKSQLIALGSSGSLTGKHSDYIIVDDLCFVAGTKIATLFGDRNIEDLKVGDLVLTPTGYKKILRTSNHDDEVVTNCGLTGTANHPIYDFRHNLFDLLVRSEYNNCSKLKLKELLQWQIAKILLNGMVESCKKQVEDIISYRQIINTGLVKCCIEQYEKNITGKFPKVMLFIIKTTIQIITTLVIWSVYHAGNIVKCTCENLKGLLSLKKILKTSLFQNWKNGENQKKDKKDLKNLDKGWLNIKKNILLMLFAQNVGSLLKCTPREEQDYVEHVESEQQQKELIKKRKQPRLLRLVTNMFNVPNAEKHTEQTSTKETKTDYVKIVSKEKGIKKNIQKVYNIEVEDNHVYYANGILVHNCNIKDRVSRAERERVKMVWMELQNVRNRGGVSIAVGTTWAKNDVFSLMPPADIYTCYDCMKYHIITKEEIENLKKTMTPSLFAANYELRFIASEDALFTDIRYLRKTDLTEEQEKLGVLPKDFLDGGVAHLDASYGGADTTALTIMRKMPDGRIIAFGKVWDKHVKQCMNDIQMLCNFYNARSLYMETNGDKGYLAQEFRYSRGMRVITYHEKMNKDLKIQTYLYGNWQDIYWLEETDANYVNQIMDYTENSETVDAPDSAACACRLLTARQAKAIEGLKI